MKRRSLFAHLYVPQAAALLLIVLAAGSWALRGARREHYAKARETLRASALMLAEALNRLPEPVAGGAADALCKALGQAAGYRFTVIWRNGAVAGDTREDPLSMENHAGRPEIRQLAGAPPDAVGWSERYSDTVRANMMYVAVPWRRNGETIGFARAARAMSDIDLALERQRARILYAALFLAALAIVGNAVIAKRLSAPLERMRADAMKYAEGGSVLRLPAARVREIDALAGAMNDMSARLDERIRTIERQRDEQKALLACMTEAVIAMDAQGRVLSMNPAAMRLFQPAGAPIAGRPLQEIIRNADIQRLRQTIMRTDGPVKEELSLPDGDRTFQVNGTAMTDAQGNRIGCVLVMTDITRIRRLETVRRDFVANVSHELKTPVTSISGFAETLIEGAAADPETRARFLEIIRRQARRLTAILDDLLTLSRLEHDAQGGRIQTHPTPIRPLLANAARTWQAEAAGKGMNLTIDCDAGLKAPVNAALVEQAMINLIGNAIKYGPPKTTVRASAGQDAHETRLSVSDEGPGIARHHLPRLFERFYRVDKSRSRDMGGTGLGLAIVKSIAVAHGGRAEVESAPGKGSVFTLRFPI